MSEQAIHDGDCTGVSGAELKQLLGSFLQHGQTCRMRMNGSSMTPFIRHGDIVTVAPVAREIKKGDVVAASDPGGRRVVLHRVVGSRCEGDGVEWRLQGDSDPEGGEWFRARDILGIVTDVSREGRRVNSVGGRMGLIVVRLRQRLRRLIGRSG